MPYHIELEERLLDYLDIPYISLFANGTLALASALQVLDLEGEVITTPYSYVASSNCILWNKLKPIFVDIEPKFGNIDPNKIKNAITDKTVAILPVHVYGNPCNVEEIKKIADENSLKVVYDAAHCFGIKYKGESILKHGDLSILSFHATKVFNTFEGGAVISNDLKLKQKIDSLKNFGYTGENDVSNLGLNSKMNEFQAAVGVLQLERHSVNIKKRKNVFQLYSNLLSSIKGISILPINRNIEHNYSYFPIFIDSSAYRFTRDELYHKLIDRGIIGRRYFYPLITDFQIYKDLPSANAFYHPIAKKLSNQVLCLPIYPDLEPKTINTIVEIIRDDK